MEDIRIAIIGHGFMGHEHETVLALMKAVRESARTDMAIRFE